MMVRLIIGIFLLLAPPSWAASDEDSPGFLIYSNAVHPNTIAQVNGLPISYSYFTNRLKLEQALWKQTHTPISALSYEDQLSLIRLRAQVVDELIEYVLLSQLVSRMKISVPSQLIESNLEGLTERLQVQGDLLETNLHQEFNQRLYFVSKKEAIKTVLKDEFESELQVSSEDVSLYLESHPHLVYENTLLDYAQFKTPSKKIAKRVNQLFKDGKSLDDIQDLSLEKLEYESSSEHQQERLSSLPIPIQDAIQSTEDGDLTEVVYWNDSYWIIQVTNRQEDQDHLYTIVERILASKKYDSWYTKIKQNTAIVINTRYIPGMSLSDQDLKEQFQPIIPDVDLPIWYGLEEFS